MGIVSFTDARGVEWRVWATQPQIGMVPLHKELSGGWLTFDSQTERRRLVPVPHGWERATAAELERLCASAVRVRRSGGHSL